MLGVYTQLLRTNDFAHPITPLGADGAGPG